MILISKSNCVNLPKINQKKQSLDSKKRYENRTDDSEVKISAAMDEDIAKVVTKHFKDEVFDVKQLQIKKKMNSTYTPCNVCMRELLVRQEFYNATLEINRPILYIKTKGEIPVRGNEDFVKYLTQNNIKQ